MSTFHLLGVLSAQVPVVTQHSPHAAPLAALSIIDSTRCVLLSKVSLGQCPGFDERAGKSGEVTQGHTLCGRSDCAALQTRESSLRSRGAVAGRSLNLEGVFYLSTVGTKDGIFIFKR